MKKIVIVFILLFVQKAYCQNNAIFYGGTGDGWSTVSYVQASNTTMNHGGNGDGWVSASYLQASSIAKNYGGVGDGWSKASYLQASNVAMYHGDTSDGYSMRNYLPLVTLPSNHGNTGDGWASNNHLPALSQTLYKGGQGDGWASNVIPLGPLPVELLSFNGKEVNEMHVLDWVTSMELNSSHFVIEHSANANFYSELGMVTAAGNSPVENKYTFTNKKPVIGNNFYRLKMVDLDEQYKYSNVILLKLMKNNTSMVVYPNPAANILNLELNGFVMNTKLQIEVMDAGGKMLKSDSYMTDNQKYTLDVSAYANGLYFLKITGNDLTEIVKFNISK